MVRHLPASLSLVIGGVLFFWPCALPGAPKSMTEAVRRISKPGWNSKAVEETFELSRVQTSLRTMRSELRQELGDTYDKTMVGVVMRTAPVSGGEIVPTKEWWDSICGKISGATPGDVSDAMSPEEIEAVVVEKVAGAKEKTLEDIDGLLQNSIDDDWGKSVQIGFAANCDLSSDPPYTWSDPTAVDLSDGLDRSGAQSSKIRKIADWDIEEEAVSSAEFDRELGVARFGRRHDSVGQVSIEAEMHSVAKIKLAVSFGIGRHKLQFRAWKGSDSRAGNNPDRVEFSFSDP